jgi:type III secretion protein U
MSDTEAKVLPPTTRKLKQARERGEIARSKELVTAAVTTAGFVTLMLVSPTAFSKFADAILLAASLDQAPLTGASELLVQQLAWAGFGIIGPLLLLLVIAAVAASVVNNGGIPFSIDPVVPKLERLDPIKGFGRLFKIRSLVELLKGVFKLAVVVAICTAVLGDQLRSLVQLPACGLSCVPGVVHGALVPLLVTCCAVFLAIGLLDVGLQRWLYRRDMRMTQTEHKRDRKDAQGDPMLLARRRQERRETAMLGARTGLKHATFVIQSSQSALAFRYSRADTPVPILVARAGTDTYHKLVLDAGRRGLPIVFDPDAVALMGSRLEVGKMIPKSVFGPVIHCMKAAGVI